MEAQAAARLQTERVELLLDRLHEIEVAALNLETIEREHGTGHDAARILGAINAIREAL